MRSENISFRQARSGKWIVFDKLPPYQGSTGYRTGHQYARFDTEAEAVEYMAELKADLDRKEAEIERMLRQPLPATPAQVDPFNHPAFWMIGGTAEELNDHHDWWSAVFVRGLSVENIEGTPKMRIQREYPYRNFAHASVVVDEGCGSPYKFGRLLRQMIEDDSEIVWRFNPTNVYFAFSYRTGKAAFYDPAKRDHIPEYVVDGEIDWFKAADSLAMPDDLITQADAARLAGVSTQAIHNATRDGRLVGYPNPNPEYERQGVTLVSRAAVDSIKWNPPKK